CSTRASRRTTQQDSNCGWMKLRWQVSVIESGSAIQGNLNLKIAGFRPTALSMPAIQKAPMSEEPTPDQPLIRSSRATLYSSILSDATVSLWDDSQMNLGFWRYDSFGYQRFWGKSMRRSGGS
ncbi:hypothetical protein, partial [Bradyrhizobium sp. SZCCHNPS2010]|uniref:hypothetical protein n=1 Tax=Bradyrhizobium sp. SZCCHNPS2010 TaxID=3057333 RepID=UPI0029166613